MVVLLFISFSAGIFVGQQQEEPIIIVRQLFNKETEPRVLTKKINFSIFWDTWDLIKDKYVEQPVSETKLFYGAMAGSVAALGDPYSVFLEPEVAKEFTQELSGELEGIGAEVGIRKNYVTIIAPLPDTPASRAGLMPGDIVYTIDGIETKGMSLDYAVSLIRGKKGTDVKLSIIRDGFSEPKDIIITRDVIDIISVNWEMKENNIAYIKVSHFNSDTSKDFKKAVKDIVLQNPKAIILDLRNNPGGYFNTAIDIANYWIDDGIIVREQFSEGEETKYSAQNSAVLNDYKTVVLVNRGSASSSEIVAGALQDNKKAAIMGEQTFGKGSVQALSSLSDGSAVKLTVAKWLTPKGNQIDEIGITPDVEVELTGEDIDAGRDPQLDKAMELLSY